MPSRPRVLAETDNGDGGTTYAPAFVNIDPTTGEITFDFSGHIHAEGLDLDAGDSDTAPADRRVRWLRESDGLLVADILGYDSAGSGSLQLAGYGRVSDGRDGFSLLLGSVEDDNASGRGADGEIETAAFSNALGAVTSARVRAIAQAIDAVGARQEIRVILNDAGESHYVQASPLAALGSGLPARWSLHFASATLDLPNTAAHTGGATALALPAGSCPIGSIVLAILEDTAGSTGLFNSFHIRQRCPTTVVDSVTLTYFNANAASVNPAPAGVIAAILRLS